MSMFGLPYRHCSALTVALAVVCLASPTHATFHLMQIEQVIGGIEGDTTAQAIQLRMRSSFQNFVGPSKLVVRDANGKNPIVIFDFTTTVPNGIAGDRILVASPGFVARTSPAAVPDFMMTNLIPPAYLAAGSLTFERDANDSAMWRLSWGGTGYTGSNQGELFTNDADGDFGPPYPFSLPSTCGRALLFPGPASAPSTTNLNDYALSADPAVFVNNAGTDFTVVATPGPCSESQIVISLDTVATGLTAPVFLTHAGDGSGRLFIVDQAGQIRIVDAGGTLLPTPFLDLTDRMVTVNPSFDERGLLGLAFHPDYAVNGRLFVRYSAPRTGVIGEPCFGTPRGCHKEVLAEFNQCILCPGDPNIADPSSEIILFEVDEPQFNHNSGQVLFGPDGLLYFSLGDGGGAHDGLADIPPSHGPTGNGQNVNTTLGSIVRIDVDGPPAPGLKYGIPPGNPFAAGGGAPEIYAYGFRNPYRFSFFDTGGLIPSRLIVGDVGQALIEEIDLLPVVPAPGLLNYGWVIREGTLCFDPLNPSVPKPACTDIGPLGETMIDPVLEYDHSVGIAVVGGFVYRGTAVPALSGKYVFGDFSQDFGPTGRLFYAGVLGLETITVGPRLEFFLAPTNEPLGKALFGIGEDENGELYVLASDNISPVGNTGVVLRIAEPPSVLPPRPEAKVTRKPRFVSFVPTNAGQQTALRLTLLSLPGPFSVWNGQQLWVRNPRPITEQSGTAGPTPAPTFTVANLQCAQDCRDWGALGRIDVFSESIVPGAVFEVQAIDCASDPLDEANYSAPLVLTTSAHGDVVGAFDTVERRWTQPEGVITILSDAISVIDKFAGRVTAPRKARVDLEPNCLDLVINISDAVQILDAFRGRAYPFSPENPALPACMSVCP